MPHNAAFLQMMCVSCSRLAFLYTKKSCVRCQGQVLVTVAVLCEVCSLTDKVCSVCLKKVNTNPPIKRGCGCGGK